jgi:hypothetical protein
MSGEGISSLEKILCGWTAVGLGRLSFHTSMETNDAVCQRSTGLTFQFP